MFSHKSSSKTMTYKDFLKTLTVVSSPPPHTGIQYQLSRVLQDIGPPLS